MRNQTRRKILLIDDDTSLLITLGDFLSFEGYDVTTADCGEQGLEVLKSLTPDLIILDMSMPGMGGIGFLREITDESGKPSHPVLVLTARANMAEFFADLDVDGFVSKPCDPADLLVEVGRIVFLRSGSSAESTSGLKTEGYKVLLAEDDDSIRESIASAFEHDGFQVFSVGKGPEVLEKAIIEKPDVIVLKLVMSSMNGDAVASVLKDMPNTKAIPIVLYDDTGSIDSEPGELERETGVKRVLKTSDAKQIVDVVRAVLV